MDGRAILARVWLDDVGPKVDIKWWNYVDNKAYGDGGMGIYEGMKQATWEEDAYDDKKYDSM